MIRNSIQTRFLTLTAAAYLVILLAALGLTSFLFGDITQEVTQAVDRSQSETYQLKLNGVVDQIVQAYGELQETLKSTGLAGTEMAKSYEAEAQENLLAALRQAHYAGKDLQSSDTYLLIVDPQARIVLHPKLPRGDGSLAPLDFAKPSWRRATEPCATATRTS